MENKPAIVEIKLGQVSQVRSEMVHCVFGVFKAWQEPRFGQDFNTWSVMILLN